MINYDKFWIYLENVFIQVNMQKDISWLKMYKVASNICNFQFIKAFLFLKTVNFRIFHFIECILYKRDVFLESC